MNDEILVQDEFFGLKSGEYQTYEVVAALRYEGNTWIIFDAGDKGGLYVIDTGSTFYREI